MLDLYFESETRRRQLRRGPLAVHLDGLAAQFQRESYARHTAQRILSIAGQFNNYVSLTKVVVETIDEASVDTQNRPLVDV